MRFILCNLVATLVVLNDYYLERAGTFSIVFSWIL